MLFVSAPQGKPSTSYHRFAGRPAGAFSVLCFLFSVLWGTAGAPYGTITGMKRGPNTFDFVYAVRNTRIVRAPERLLDPFDQTLVNYTLLAQPMDDPTKTRVREGKLQTFPPRLLLPVVPPSVISHEEPPSSVLAYV